MRTLKLLPLLLLFFSCNDDPDPNEQTNGMLEGVWDATSVTLDGVETIGFGFISGRFTFTKESSDIGQLSFAFVAAIATVVEGPFEYTVVNEGTKLRFIDSDLNVSFVGNEVRLNGNLAGQRWEIEAVKI